MHCFFASENARLGYFIYGEENKGEEVFSRYRRYLHAVEHVTIEQLNIIDDEKKAQLVDDKKNAPSILAEMPTVEDLRRNYESSDFANPATYFFFMTWELANSQLKNAEFDGEYFGKEPMSKQFLPFILEDPEASAGTTYNFDEFMTLMYKLPLNDGINREIIRLQQIINEHENEVRFIVGTGGHWMPLIYIDDSAKENFKNAVTHLDQRMGYQHLCFLHKYLNLPTFIIEWSA